MLQFQIFRIKVFPSEQGNLFQKKISPPEILRFAIKSVKSIELRKGLTWHIGNVEYIDAKGLYCRIGRTSKSTLEIFDDIEERFKDQEFETAPYTHVILDLDLELCAIAKRPRISNTTIDIARKLVSLLNRSEAAIDSHALFEIEELKDPDDFIKHLKSAYSIKSFYLKFSRPNAWDADEDFIKPAQKSLEKVNGVKGKLELRGQNLNPDALESLTRSVAATGEDATAIIKQTKRTKWVSKKLKGNPVNFTIDDIPDKTKKNIVLERMRELYKSIRG